MNVRFCFVLFDVLCLEGIGALVCTGALTVTCCFDCCAQSSIFVRLAKFYQQNI